MIARNPCLVQGAGVEHSPERPVPTVAQVWAVADAIDERYRCIILLAGFVSLGRGELLGVECQHLNLLHGTLTVAQQQPTLRSGEIVLSEPKTAAGARTLKLPGFLVGELEGHLKPVRGSWTSWSGVPGRERADCSARHAGEHWTKARKTVGVPPDFHFHDLRHTANHITASSGASTNELMLGLGHSSPQAALRCATSTPPRTVTRC